MSRTWKWMLGILGVLIVIGLVAGAFFMWRNHGLFERQRVFMYTVPQGPMMGQAPGGPDGSQGFRRYHMDEWGGGMPMMERGYRHSPVGFGSMGVGLMVLGGLFHLLLPLGVLALVAYVFYQMGKRAGATSGARPAPATLPNVDALPRRRVARK